MIFATRRHQKEMKNAKNIGLVLSGGAVKGFAHLGVLQALDEMNMKPVILSGTSAGAIAAAFYADGYSPAEALSILKSYRLKHFFRPGFRNAGVMRNSGFYKILLDHLRCKNLENLPLETWICMTNLYTGKAEYHNYGNIARKVLASSSIPIFFRPVMIDDQLMVDGGVCDNLPLIPILGKVELIVASNSNPIVEKKIKPSFRSIAERTFLLSINSRNQYLSPQPDILIEPPQLAQYGYFDIDHAEKIFETGYECAIQTLTRLRF